MGALGFVSKLLFGASASGASEVMAGAGELAKDLRTAITGELPPDERAKLEAKALEIEAQIKLGQMKVNEAEANSTSLFVAGWRPAIGWICALALAYHFIMSPLINWACAIWYPSIAAPAFDMSSLMTILMGMLGLSGMRSYEKTKEVHGNH